MARRGDNIHKRKDGRWEGRYKDGYRADGSAKYNSLFAYSYSECKKKLTDAQSSSKSFKKVQTEKLFSDLLIQWLFANQIRLKGGNRNKIHEYDRVTHYTCDRWCEIIGSEFKHDKCIFR